MAEDKPPPADTSTESGETAGDASTAGEEQ
jgi:hypothetical protein